MARPSQTHAEITKSSSRKAPAAASTKGAGLENEDISKSEIIESVVQELTLGPIPAPRIMEQYDKLLPGSADRILKMAEAQSYSEIELLKNKQRIEARDSLLGIICGTVISVVCIIASIKIATAVPNAAGAVCGALLGATGMGSVIITLFKVTRQNSEKEND